MLPLLTSSTDCGKKKDILVFKTSHIITPIWPERGYEIQNLWLFLPQVLMYGPVSFFQINECVWISHKRGCAAEAVLKSGIAELQPDFYTVNALQYFLVFQLTYCWVHIQAMFPPDWQCKEASRCKLCSKSLCFFVLPWRLPYGDCCTTRNISENNFNLEKYVFVLSQVRPELRLSFPWGLSFPVYQSFQQHFT